MAAFDCMRLLRSAVPTPAIPLAPRAPHVETAVVAEATEPPPLVRSRRAEVANAALLFAVLTAGSSLAAGIVAAFFP